MEELLVVHSRNRYNDINFWFVTSLHRNRGMDGRDPKNIDGNSALLDGGHIDPLITPIIKAEKYEVM